MNHANPTKVIDKLNQEAWTVRVSNSPHAYDLSRKAFSLANDINYIKGKGESLRTLGFCNIRLAKFQEAMPLLEEAFLIFTNLNDLRGLSDVFEYIGIIKRSLGDYAASLEHLIKGAELREQIGYKEGLSLSYYHIGITYKYLGYLEQALEYLLKSLELGRKLDYQIAISYSINNIGVIYADMGNNQDALIYYQESLKIRKELGDKWGEAGCLDNIGLMHHKLGDNNQASIFCLKSLVISKSTGDKKGQGNSFYHLGLIHAQLDNLKKAVKYAYKSLKIRREIGDKKGESELLIFLSIINQDNSTLEIINVENILENALKIGEELKAKDLLSHIHLQLYKFYKNANNIDVALKHIEKHNSFEKENFSQTFNQKLINIQISHQVEKSRKEAEIYQLKNIELVQLNTEIQKQKNALEIQRINLEETLNDLRSTQAQLIQKEKLASLGELTAGIAHEIQNPLNFVNNFSEVSSELVGEMNQELDKGDINEAKEIANDLKKNLEKINHHGKRASSIVKGMLEHSRTSTGLKELTDINALADEYLRLAYHGLRAKDNYFNSDFKTDFDENLPKIEVIPQDMGRVLLNLINNAFWAVNERSKKGEDGYEPKVTVSTNLNANSQLLIAIKDNGSGMTDEVKAKIFQPFFTTKPTGQGTGLGLSLAYDIVTKGHGGTVEVESVEGEGTTFIVKLPIKNN